MDFDDFFLFSSVEHLEKTVHRRFLNFCLIFEILVTSGNIIVRNMILTDKEPFLALYEKMRQKFKNRRRYVFSKCSTEENKKKSSKSIENSRRR